MTIAALITEGIGPGGTVPLLLTGGLDQGVKPPDIITVDTHDPGIKKRRKQAAALERKRIDDERERQERRREQVIDAFERIVEGKTKISAPVADEIVAKIEAAAPEQISAPDFTALLQNLNTLEQLWADYLERDDEEVLGLI